MGDMLQGICSINGKIVPAAEAVVSVDNLAFTYGHGVYENIKTRHGIVHWPEEHVDRLYRSAEEIGLSIRFAREEVLGFLTSYAEEMNVPAYNIKMLFVDDVLYIFSSNPKYIPSSAYKEGVCVLLRECERPFPRAKALSMLTSYIAYTSAREKGAYDALLVDRDDYVLEGSRSNLFYTDGTAVYTPPGENVLEGVTRKHVMQVCKTQGIDVGERMLKKNEIEDFAGFFLTSTSAKVLAIRKIDGREFAIPRIIRDIAGFYERFVEKYRKNEGV